MRVSFVDEALIKVVTAEQLEVGDEILWSNNRCKIVKILQQRPYSMMPIMLFTIQLFPEDPEITTDIPRYHSFFKILESKMKEIEL